MMAEASATSGQPHAAISELYFVHAELVAVNALRDAALVSARILELHLLTGRQTALVAAAQSFVRTLGGAGMPLRCLDAISWLERRAAAASLTVQEVGDVRRWFEDAPSNLELQPRAWTRTAVG